jgi:hypothetical protein
MLYNPRVRGVCITCGWKHRNRDDPSRLGTRSSASEQGTPKVHGEDDYNFL